MVRILLSGLAVFAATFGAVVLIDVTTDLDVAYYIPLVVASGAVIGLSLSLREHAKSPDA